MAALPLIVFDVDETLLDLETLPGMIPLVRPLSGHRSF